MFFLVINLEQGSLFIKICFKPPPPPRNGTKRETASFEQGLHFGFIILQSTVGVYFSLHITYIDMYE